MVDRKFWEAAANAWKQADPAPENQTGQKPEKIAEASPADAFGEEIPFDMVDHERAYQTMMEGGDIPLKSEYAMSGSQPEPAQPKKPSRPPLDQNRFADLLGKETIAGDVEACELLLACRLPSKMDGLCRKLIERLPVLQEAAEKTQGFYQADLSPFTINYIPEVLQLIAGYLEYLDLDVDVKIIEETETEILQSLEHVVQSVNDQINEIYRYASVEMKARAKALETMMNQDGFVDEDVKL